MELHMENKWINNGNKWSSKIMENAPAELSKAHKFQAHKRTGNLQDVPEKFLKKDFTSYFLNLKTETLDKEDKSGYIQTDYQSRTKEKNLFKRDLKVPELPTPDLPKLPSSLPKLPEKSELPKMPSIDVPVPKVPEIPKVDVPDVSKLPKVDLPDVSKIPKLDLPKLPRMLHQKLEDQQYLQNPIQSFKRNIQKRHLPIPKLPMEMPKLPDLPEIPSVDVPKVQLPSLPQLPEIPIPDMPKLPGLSGLSSLNHVELYPSYDLSQFTKYISPIKRGLTKGKRAVFSNSGVQMENNKVPLRVERIQQETIPSTPFKRNELTNIVSVPPSGSIPLSKPTKIPISGHRSNGRRHRKCDDEKITYKETTKIVINEDDSDESDSRSSEETILSKILPKSLNPEHLFRPLSPTTENLNEARQSKTRHRHDDDQDECVEEIVYEDVTEVIFTERDDSSERRFLQMRKKDESNDRMSYYSQPGLNNEGYIQMDRVAADDMKFKQRRKKRGTEEIHIEDEKTVYTVELQNSKKQQKPKNLNKSNGRIKAVQKNSVRLGEEIFFEELNAKILQDENGGKYINTQEKTVIDEEVVIKENLEGEDYKIEENDKKRKKRETKQNDRDKIMGSEHQFKAGEGKLKDRKSLVTPIVLQDEKIVIKIPVTDVRPRGKPVNLNANLIKLNSGISEYDNYLDNSKLTANTEFNDLKAFFTLLKEKSINSEYNVNVEINEKLLADDNELQKINGLNESSVTSFNINFPQMQKNGFLVNKQALSSINAGKSYLDRDKRTAAPDDTIEIQEEEVEVVVKEKGSPKKSKKGTISDDDNDLSEPETKKSSTSSTTSSTTTPSTTSEFSEEETTEYDYDAEEEPCPTDIIGTVTTKIRCVFNTITSKIIGIEIGPACCDQ